MTIKRRNFLGTTTSFFFSILSLFLLSLAQKKNTNLPRKRSLPFFLGWYGYIEDTDSPSRITGRNINIFLPYTERSKPEKIKTFLDNAQAVGIKVLVEIYRPIVESADIVNIKKFIRTYKNHPAVYGWYLYDEPEVKKPNPISPTLLKNIYRAIKQEDKSKPVAIVFNDVNKVEPYVDALDIMMWDTYPCHDGKPELEWAGYYRSVLNQIITTASIHNKKFWNVIQSYGGHGGIARLPTKAEFYYMFYCSIYSSVDGLFFWMYPWSTPTWNESVLYPIIKEFKEYLPTIMKGVESKNLAPIDVGSRLDVKSFTLPNSKKAVVIAINHDKTAINTLVKIDRKLTGKLVISNDKKMSQISNVSELRISLNPYEVRLYKIG
jgi:Glycosyl hydrolases family 2, TIM barrel domain